MSITDNSFNYLCKTEYQCKDLRFGTFDIETEKFSEDYDISKDKLELKKIGFYNGYPTGYFNNNDEEIGEGKKDWNRYFEFNTYDTFLGEILKKKYWKSNYKFYAHYGGKFDFLPVLECVNKYDYDFEIVDTNGKIIQIRIPFNITKNDNDKLEYRNHISLRDSYSLMKDKLSKITHSFNVKHKKLDFDFDKDYDNEEKLKEYLKNDVIGLFESIKYFESIIHDYNTNIQLTIASTSLSSYRNNFLDYIIYPINKNVNINGYGNVNIENLIRKYYVGGRTEIFKRYGKNLYYYDVNSLYPYTMLSNYPISSPLVVDGKSVNINKDNGFAYCRLKFNRKDILPLIPKKIEGISKYGKLLFPIGEFEGLYELDMIRKAHELGYEVEIKFGILFEYAPIFKSFVNTFYELRKKNDSFKIIFKYLLNSLYGKFAQKRNVKQILKVTNNDYLKQLMSDGIVKSYIDEFCLYEIEKDIDLVHIIPSISSSITQKSQLVLYELFEKCNHDIFNCDTDSIVTSKKLNYSNKLGDIKIEYIINEACFILPKFYCFKGYDVSEDKEILVKKMKGFENTEKYSFNDFLDCLINDNLDIFNQTKRNVWGFKESLKRKNQFFTYLPRKKSLKSLYDKRIILKDNINTVPLKVYDNEILG